MDELFCCYIDATTGDGCKAAPRWEIYDENRWQTPDAAYTLACDEHVGLLLEDGHIFRVYPARSVAEAVETVPDSGFPVSVNGAYFKVASYWLTREQVVALAVKPDEDCDRSAYTVRYTKAPSGKHEAWSESAVLGPGQGVNVVHGAIFDVARTGAA